MNKKGLIFILLFVVSTIGAMSVTQAATDDKVEIRLNYIPSAYVPTGSIYVEFDSRFIDDNMVFGKDDTINFAFFYDVAVLSWGGATTTGDGFQADYWYYDTQNVSAACQYTETRFGGIFNVMFDNYDIGMTNFDIWADSGNYQDIAISLDIGWHYITIMAAELVSDCNHTEFHWEYTKDEKKFFVGQDKDDTPSLMEDALGNVVDLTVDVVDSLDLNAGFNWTGFLSNPRPKAEATLNQYYDEVLGTEAVPVHTDIAVRYNASDTDFAFADGPYGVMYDNYYELGPHTYAWILNDGDMDVINETYTPVNITGLQKGQNYIYFCLVGFQIDSYSQLYDNWAPQLTVSTVRFDLFIGDRPEDVVIDPCADCPCPTPTPGFGIFISVSMLGLAAVLYLVRRRK